MSTHISFSNLPILTVKVVAILSTTVIPNDGIYQAITIKDKEQKELILSSLSGLQHYIGHPDTKTLLENLGAVKAPTSLFSGLNIGESCLCVPIKQGMSTRAIEGFTYHQVVSEFDTLDIKILTRLA